MVKKLKQMAEKQAAGGAGLFDSALAGSVRESAQQIWLAGMGAFSKAQAEGGKVFEALVKEGMSLQKKTQSAAEDKFAEVSQKMSGMASEMQAKAGQHWDKLEGIFEERTAKALGKLGVPKARDVDALVARIAALEADMARLSKRTPGSASTRTPAKAAADKAMPAAAKRTPGKAAAGKSAPNKRTPGMPGVTPDKRTPGSTG